MRNQVALVVQQVNMMKHVMRPANLPQFHNTSGLCFGNRYVVSYRSNATDWFDFDNAYIEGYDDNAFYGCVKDLIVELFTNHGVNMDFDNSIPVSVLEVCEAA
jgi:hypothetical protein